MEEKKIASTQLRPEGNRTTKAPLVSIDIYEAIQNIRQETSWETGDRNAITLYKSDQIRVVLVALHQGAELTRHTADCTISVQVLEGKIMFNTDEKSEEMNVGQMVVLQKDIPHEVKAIAESVFLLTLVPDSE